MGPQVTTQAITPAIGVEIRGLTGQALLDPSVAATCGSLLDEHGVVVYRGAHLTDPELVAYSRMLGQIVVPPMGGLPDHPEVTAISLDPAQDELAAYRRGTFFWHIDGVTDPAPQKATLLVAHNVGNEGGDTEFATTYAAYDALSQHEKAALSAVRVVHSFAASQSRANPDATAKERAAWARGPSREHPLVWTRPNGRTSLLVGTTTDHVVGAPPDESRVLLDRLLAWCTRPQFVLRHRWEVGDLVVWDNTGILHRALPYEPTSQRLLHRTTLVGEVTIA